MSSGLRAAFSFVAGVALASGCGATTATGTPGVLPTITMTSGGGFDSSSEKWTIGPDGSWTWVRKDKLARPGDLPSPQPGRSGRLTEAQLDELTDLAFDPLLRDELRAGHGDCDISDGPAERLEVGSIKYLASWCDESRPQIRRMRERIVALTTGA